MEALNGVLPNHFYTGGPLDPESKHYVNTLSVFVYPAFILLGFISLFSAIFSWLLVVKSIFQKTELNKSIQLLASLQFVGWTNLIFVAFVNIPTPRYLMPHFALFLIATSLFLLMLFRRYKHKFTIKNKA